MRREFTIGFDWLSRENGSAVERATLSELEISVDRYIATKVEDLMAKTVRNRVRLSAYHLATWLTHNWWRLRWEPERKDLSWQMSHKMGAAGGGYVWPDLEFCGDGETILIRSRATSPSRGELVRYLENFDSTITAGDFETEVDDYVNAVIARLEGERVNAPDLANLWAEVREERREPERTAWRKLEAILGYDPDEAPEELVEELLKIESSCGAGAVAEVAAAAKDEAPKQLAQLWNDVRPKAITARIASSVELRKKIHKDTSKLPLPWQRAARAATIARTRWGLDRGPVSTSYLAELCDVPERAIVEPDSAMEAPFSTAFRNGEADNLAVFLNKKHPTARRFALARLVGDHIAVAGEKLLPSTNSKTARQKFQRAFAQEFLCPFADLNAFLDTDDPTDELVELAADHFEVSPLLVKTTLVNRGLMDRDTLNT